MKYRIYILNIHLLEAENVYQRALLLLDHVRREYVCKFKNEKDQLRAIAAGLLLQIGLLEVPVRAYADQNGAAFKAGNEAGIPYGILQAEEVIEALERIQQSDRMNYPRHVVYRYGKQGKPFWDESFLDTHFPDKEYPYFNLSHSGEYVGIAIANRQVGLDIQEPKRIRKYFEDYRAFSQMEAYVKCTGEGFAKGLEEYLRSAGKENTVFCCSYELSDGYVCNLCIMRS